jgi:hypothetical protein
MQTLQNGIDVPTNSDPYNLTGDLAAAFGDANVVVPVASKAVRDALTKKDGLVVARMDLGGVIEIWDVSTSAWTKGFQHAEFTGSTVPDIPTTAPTWGTGPLTLDTNASHYGGIFTSPGNDKISLPGGGLYSISVRVQMSTGATGTTWVALTNDGNTFTYTSADILAGASSGAMSIPNFYAPATQNVRVVFFSTTAAGYTLQSRIRVSRIG